MRKLPFDNCIACGKSIDRIGGKRIVKCQNGGILPFTFSMPLSLAGIESQYAYFHRFKNDPRILVAWGSFVSEMYMDIVMEEVEEIVKDHNKRPWICQKCLQFSLCKKCGSPLIDTSSASILDDNGRVTLGPILGISNSCSKGCK